MRKVTKYFLMGLILQLLVIANLVYWFTLISSLELRQAIDRYSANLPSFLQDATVVMLIVAAATIVSMLCYGYSRKLSFKMPFRNLVMGLILVNAIILLWVILTML